MAYGSIASLAVDVSADIAKLRADFQQANREATKQMAALQKNVKGSLDSIEGQAKRAGQAILASFGAIGVIEITKRLAGVADGYQNAQAKLKLVTRSQQELTQASADTFRIAQKTYSSYDATATLIGRVTRSLETLGTEHTAALKDSKALAETMAEGLAISGASASESSASIIQMTQALASNKLAGDEFRSFMENAPRLSQALSSALGKTIGELRELSKDGKLTTEIVTKGLLSQAAVIKSEFVDVPLTVGRAWQQLSNYFMVYIGAGAQATGVSRGLADALIWVGKNLDAIGKVIATGAVVFLARQISSVVSSVMSWVYAQQLSAAWTEASLINAAKDAQAQSMVAATTAAAAQAKVVAAKAAQAELAATAAVIAVAQEEQVVKLRAVQVQIAMAEATLVAARARGAQSAAIAVALEAEANLTRLQAARMGIVNELAALGVNNAKSMASQAVAAQALAVAEAELAAAQTAAAGAATRAAAAQTAAAGASGAAATGIAGLGRGLLAFVGGPVGLTIAGVAALGYALYALSDSADSASNKADELIAQFNKAAEAAKNFSVSPIEQINLSTDEVLGQLKKELAQAEQDLADISQRMGNSTGRMADMYSGQAAQAQAVVDSLRQKINDLGVSSAMAAEAERQRSAEIAKGNKLAEEARKLLAQQLAGTQGASKATEDWADKTAKAYEQVRNAIDPMARLNDEFDRQRQQLEAAAILWADQPDKLAEIDRLMQLLNMQYKYQTNAAREAFNPTIKGGRDAAAQLRRLDKAIDGATDAQLDYSDAVEEANRQAAEAIALGSDDAEIKKGLADWLKTLGELRDKSDMMSFITEFTDTSGFDDLIKKIKDAEKQLESLGETGSEALRDKLGKAIINARVELGYRMTGAARTSLESLQSMTKEGSKSFKILQVAIDATTLAEAVLAVIHQASSGDVYTAIPRMAAMVAAIAALGVSIGNVSGGGGPSKESAEYRQMYQGTGTILGDAEAKSDSIAKAVEITANATTELVGINRGMLNALRSLQNALGAAGNQLARGAGDAEFSGLHNTSYGLMGPLGQFDPMLNAMTGAYDPVGQAIGSLVWGGRQSVIDQGIIIAGGTMQEMIEQVMVGAYQTVHTSGGWFGSGSDDDALGSVSDQFETQFQLVINSIADAVTAGAEALGVLPEDIQAAMEAYRLEEIRISLMDLSAEEQQAELEAVFSSIFDGLAGAVVPFVAQFQQVGEGLGETLVRVATGVQVTQEAMRQLGLVINETDPERFAQISEGLISAVGGLDEYISGIQSFASNFANDSRQFEISFNAISSALEQVGLSVPDTRDAMYELMGTLDATTAEGQEQIATLIRLAGAAGEYYSALDRHNKALQDAQELLNDMGLPGGLSRFRQQLREIDDQAQEAVEAYNLLARAAGRAGASETELAMVHKWVAEQTKAAIAALRNSTADLISQLYGGTPGSLDEINRRIQAMEELNSTQLDGINNASNAAQEMWQKQKDAIEEISDFLDSLLLGDLTNLTPEQQLMEAQRQYLELLALAQAGNADALAALPDAAQAYLEQARDFYSATSGYSQIFEDVTNALRDIVGVGPGQQPIGTGTNGSGVSSELQQLYAQRDAAVAQQEAANRLLLAQQLAQQLGDLSEALGIPIFQLAETMGVSMAMLMADLGINLANFTETTGMELAGVAAMLGVSVLELASQLGVSMSDLVVSMGINLSDLSANTAVSIGEVAAALGVTVQELAGALAISMSDLVTALGVNLGELTATTVQAMAELAGDMGMSLADLAESVGVDLGELADSQSLLNEALSGVIEGLPDGAREALEPLLEAISSATTEADANAAIEALRTATEGLPEDQRDLLAPYFEEIDPTAQLSDLEWLQTLSTQSNQQISVLQDMRGYLQQIAGSGAAGAGSATTAGGLPEYATGSSYIMGDQVAKIHHGEMVIDQAGAAVLRTYGVSVSSDSTASSMLEKNVAALRESLEESNEQNTRAILERLEAIEQAVYAGSGKVSMAISAKSDQNRTSWSR